MRNATRLVVFALGAGIALAAGCNVNVGTSARTPRATPKATTPPPGSQQASGSTGVTPAPGTKQSPID
ncbi:MAG: hypothetical protein FJZ01_09015 [Candidatus Sericytochromatia bacterium]|nr:hypothetical protein [Candidatus Tanganyikabacteria bacterium]